MRWHNSNNLGGALGNSSETTLDKSGIIVIISGGTGERLGNNVGRRKERLIGLSNYSYG
jgi:hypothetical protein